MNKPWYKDGLRFKCTGCGECCTGSPGAVWVNDREIAEIARFLGLSEEDFLKRYTRLVDGRRSLIEKEHYDCVFLQGKRCSIYPVRPIQCQTFPYWPGILESERHWESAKNYCEGINDDAPLVTLKEIEREKTRYEQNR